MKFEQFFFLPLPSCGMSFFSTPKRKVVFCFLRSDINSNLVNINGCLTGDFR